MSTATTIRVRRPVTRESRGGPRDASSLHKAVAVAATPGAGPLDPWLLSATVALLGLGLVLIYSSSTAHAARTFGDAEYFLKLQAKWIVVGIGGLLLALRLPSSWLRRRAGLLLVGATVLCTLVLVPGLGRLVGGARRWLAVGALGFQPSELAKLAVVVLVAAILARRDESPEAERPSLLVPVLLAQVPVILVLAEPDLGTALVLELIVATVVFTAGLRLRVLIFGALTALPVFYHLILSTPWRRHRLLSYIDPWAYRSTVGYQVTEALISIGSGGLFGVGLGESKHKLFFLPEAHTDFIFAILAEELGLAGVLLLLVLIAIVIWRGVRAATHAAIRFDGYLAMGMTALVGIPAVFNVCVATGLLPTKGLPLPLVSYGGSNLVATLIAIGVLLRIERDGCAASGKGRSGR